MVSKVYNELEGYAIFCQQNVRCGGWTACEPTVILYMSIGVLFTR